MKHNKNVLLLFRFLKNNDCFKQYFANLKKLKPQYFDKYGHLNNDFINICLNHRSWIIASSFSWGMSNESREFWAGLDKQYKIFYKNNIKFLK